MILGDFQKTTLQTHRKTGKGYEFHLEGRPWLASRETAIRVRFTVLKLIEYFYANRYRLLTSFDATKRLAGDKNTLVFTPTHELPSLVRSICISLVSSNMMLLMGDFTDFEMDEVQKVVSKWPLGVCETSWQTAVDSTEISKFKESWRMYGAFGGGFLGLEVEI